MHLTKTIIVVIASLATFTALGPAHANPEAAPDTTLRARTPEPVKHVVHAELTTLLIVNAVSINYERFLSDNFALRLGYTASSMLILTDSASAHGPTAALTFLAGGDHNFELTAGIAVVTSGRRPPFGAELGGDWYVNPVWFAGYRWQPETGGLIGRVGLGVSGGYGAFATLGMGAAF